MSTDAVGKSRSRLPLVLLLLLLVVVAAGGWMWQSGMFQSRAKLAMVTAGSTGTYWELIERGAKDAADRYNVNLTVIHPSSSDEPSQTTAIQALMGKGYDGVAISPNDPPRQASALADIAADTNGNLITFDSDSAVSRRLCFIGTDNYDAGRVCAEYIRQAIPAGGEVIISIGSLDKENGQRRRQGVIDGLLERSMERLRPMDPVDGMLKDQAHPKYTVVATLIDGIDPAKATAMAADALKKYPDVKCFAGLFAYSTPSILKALSDANQLGKVQIVGFDANESTLDGVEAGTVYTSVIQDAYGIGFQAIRTLADVTRGDKRFAVPMFPTVYLSADPATKANVAAVKQDLERKRSGHTREPAMAAPAATQPATAPA